MKTTHKIVITVEHELEDICSTTRCTIDCPPFPETPHQVIESAIESLRELIPIKVRRLLGMEPTRLSNKPPEKHLMDEKNSAFVRRFGPYRNSLVLEEPRRQIKRISGDIWNAARCEGFPKVRRIARCVSAKGEEDYYFYVVISGEENASPPESFAARMDGSKMEELVRFLEPHLESWIQPGPTLNHPVFAPGYTEEPWIIRTNQEGQVWDFDTQAFREPTAEETEKLTKHRERAGDSA